MTRTRTGIAGTALAVSALVIATYIVFFAYKPQTLLKTCGAGGAMLPNRNGELVSVCCNFVGWPPGQTPLPCEDPYYLEPYSSP